MDKLFALFLKAGLIVLFFSGCAYALEQQAKEIFIVHSYCLKNICGAPQDQGVLEGLAASGFEPGRNLVVHRYAMHTKVENNTVELIDQQAAIVLEKVKEVRPDVLILLDDNAFRTVGLSLVDSDINIVFSGMNGLPEDYDRKVEWMESRDKPGHNITGVYEKLHFFDAFKVQKMLIPGLKKALIVSDGSPTGRAVMKQIDREIAETEKALGLSFEIGIVPSWEKYIQLIEKACVDKDIGTIYPAATLLKDKAGRIHSTEEIIKWTVDNCRKPGVPLNYSFARLGMLGGAGVDFIAMGRQAGVMAGKILKGTPPGDIAVEDAYRYALVFNLHRAEVLGIDIPADILMAADAVYK